MPVFYKCNVIQRIVSWIVFFMLFLLSGPAIGSAESPPSPMDLIRCSPAIIQGKTHSAVIVNERHFVVTESTTILDVNGEKILLGDFPIPCEADIEYQLRMDQDPVALKITIKRALKGASTIWPPPGSE